MCHLIICWPQILWMHHLSTLWMHHLSTLWMCHMSPNIGQMFNLHSCNIIKMFNLHNYNLIKMFNLYNCNLIKIVIIFLVDIMLNQWWSSSTCQKYLTILNYIGMQFAIEMVSNDYYCGVNTWLTLSTRMSFSTFNF